jgi:tetratricopeptide (TPR) repeat protein
VELGRFEQAEADFNTAAQLRPKDVEVLTARGTYYADRDRLDTAVTDFAAAMALAPRGEPPTRWFGNGAEQIEDLVAERDNLFERMIALTPDDRYLWIARAHHFGKDLRYKESLPPLLKAVELDPSDHIGWIHAAAVRLALGDEEGYRKLCHEMLTRFAKDNGPRVASRVAKTCLLAPLPAEDQAPLRALVERVEQEGAGSSGVTLRWDYFVKGLAEYRAGRFTEAITLLKLGLPSRAASPLNDGPTLLVLAMAQFRLGEADKARASLAAAQGLLERTLPRLDRGERHTTVWPDRARLEVLRREAIALIEGPDAAALQPGGTSAQAAAPAPK